VSARCQHRCLSARTEADGCSSVVCRCGFSGPRKHSYALTVMVDREALKRSPTAAPPAADGDCDAAQRLTEARQVAVSACRCSSNR
jgi:hypothetical protein